MKISALILTVLCCAWPAAARAQTTPPKPVILAAPHMPLGDNQRIIRLQASTLVRWTEGTMTFADLRGKAHVFQGVSVLRAPRILVRFATAEKNGRTLAALEAYADSGAHFQIHTRAATADIPNVYRLTTPAGVLLQGGEEIGDAPPPDSFLLRAIACLNTKPGAQLPENVPESILGQIRPSAEEMVMADLTDNGVVFTLRGNARVAGRDFYLSADAIRLRIGFRNGRFKNPRVLSIYAEGAADLHRNTERITAEALYLDMLGEEAIALKARVRGIAPEGDIPVHFYAGVVRQVSRYRFICQSPGFFSTSQFATPHYRVEGRRPEIIRGPGWHRWRERDQEETKAGTEDRAQSDLPQSVVVSSRDNLVYVTSIPVFYWPFISKDVTTGAFLIRSLEYSNSSNLGSTVKAAWNLYDLGLLYNDWSELTLYTDGYSRRGFGIGARFDYEGESREGFAKFYYIHDSSDTDDENLLTPTESRGEITWQHREKLPYNIVADVDTSRVSDRNFLRIYDREEWDNAKDRETTIFLRRHDANRLYTAQWTSRINYFQNTVERQTVGFHTIGEPVFDTPLLWTSHTEVGRLNLRMDDDLNRPDAVARADSAHELSWPFQLGPVRLDPFIWGDLAYFSDQIRENGNAVRAASALGLRAATNFYRTFDIQSKTFSLDRIRHILTPTLEYLNLWGVTKEPKHLVQHDEIDALDQDHTLRAGIHNRLQTHRYIDGKRQTTDFLTADLDYVGRFRKTLYNQNEQDKLEASLNWHVDENITLASTDNRLNLATGELERLNGAISLNYWRPFEIGFSQSYYLDTEIAHSPQHLVSAITCKYQPVYSRWRVELSTAYDFEAERQAGDTKDPKDLSTAITFYRQLDDWELALGVELGTGRSGDTRITAKLTPPGSVDTTRSFR